METILTLEDPQLEKSLPEEEKKPTISRIIDRARARLERRPREDLFRPINFPPNYCGNHTYSIDIHTGRLVRD